MRHILVITIILFFSGYTQAIEIDAAQDFYEVQDYYNEGHKLERGFGSYPPNYKEAVKWYRKAAELGHFEASYTLGEYYMLGQYDGIPQDYKEAEKWYRKAAEQGHKDAQRKLEIVLKKPPRKGEYDAEAQYKIAEEFMNKHANYTEAEKWYRKAAEQGHIKAQIRLGDIYYGPLGVERDYGEAIKWYGKAAEQGSRVAKSSLVGVQKSIESSKNNNKELSPMKKMFLATIALIVAKKVSDSLSSNNNTDLQVGRKGDPKYDACSNRIVSCRVFVGSCDMVGNCNYNRYCDSNTGLLNGDCARSQYEKNYYCDPETRKQNIEFDRLVNRVCSK